MKTYFARLQDGIVVEAMMCNTESADEVQLLLGPDWVRMYEPR